MSRDALSKISFEELIQRVREGDIRAFDELFRRSEETLTKWANGRLARRLPGGDRPSDISQAFSVRVLEKFPQFKGTTAGEWFGWLKTAFRNHANESRRSAKAQKRDSSNSISLSSEQADNLPSLAPRSSQFVAHKDEWQRLMACVYRLPEEDQRTAIHLHRLNEIPVAEVARLMNRTESSVAGLLARGWKQVRDWMNAPFDPDALAKAEPSPRRDVEAALMAYLRRRDVGHEVDLETFVAEYPSCDEELRDIFHWMEQWDVKRPSWISLISPDTEQRSSS